MQWMIWGVPPNEVSNGWLKAGHRTYCKMIRSQLMHCHWVQNLQEVKKMGRLDHHLGPVWHAIVYDQASLKQLKESPFIGQSIYWLPEAESLQLEWQLEMLLEWENKRKQLGYVEKITMLLLGNGNNVGQILKDVWPKFKWLQKKKRIVFYANVGEEIGMVEVSELEDVLKEYLREDCQLTVETSNFCSFSKDKGYLIYSRP